MRSPSIKIGRHHIGPGNFAYVIAEVSANHHQQFEEAVRIILAAKEAGADGVKVQTYKPDTITIASDRPEFRISGGTIWDGRNLHDLYTQAFTPWEWLPKLTELARSLDLNFFSSPFDASAVDFLETINVPAYKLASPELVDIPLIQKIARIGKPMIMSTGMATLEEIQEAVQATVAAGAKEIALLKCTSAYPALPEEMSLLTIPELARRFSVPVGLSDHTLEVIVPVAAVALGACIVEKHLTLSRAVPGPDSAFSLEPREFRAMVDAIRVAEKAVGRVPFELSARETANRVFRRSLYVVEDVKAGEAFTERNVRSIRPACGLHPRHLREILGKQAAQDIKRGTPFTWGLATLS